MLRLRIYCRLLCTLGLICACGPLFADESLRLRGMAAVSLLDSAEERFVAPDPQWFETTREALSEETHRVGRNLDSHGEAYAMAWKKHLRWPLLTSNLGNASEVQLEELAVVRRWLYSNRKGLEYPFFAELRKRIDAHLDAVFSFTQPNLENAFQQQVVLLRQQIESWIEEPNEKQAAALGRSLGWLERTRQLPQETAALRTKLSFPNAQMVVSKPLIDRAIALLATEVEQSLPVSDRVVVPSQGLLSKPRTAHVHGSAYTKGLIRLELENNVDFADLKIAYRGEIESRCRAIIGPLNVAMQTVGPVRAITPVQVSLQGVKLLATEVFPQVRTRVTSVSARSNLVRRIGKRRVHEPKSYQQMNSRASMKTANLIQQEMDKRVAEAFAEIQAEFRKMTESLNSFQEILAPVVREGATPRWESVQSSAEGVIVNVASQRREQFGASEKCPSWRGTADVQTRIHVSFFNNIAETIMAGKTFSDTYFMNYGKILHAELPPPLMVHARSKRWAIVAAKPRPLEISIPDSNQFRIVLKIQQVDIGEEHFTGQTIATVNYSLVQDDFDEYLLERWGAVHLESPLPETAHAFLLAKLNAFFAPVLNGGGVALPEGGALGRLRGLQPQGVFADRDWVVMGVNVPSEVLEAWMPKSE